MTKSRIVRSLSVITLATVAALMLGGCPIADLIGGGGGNGGSIFDGLGGLFGRPLTLKDVAPALDFPEVPAARVRVEVLNLSNNDATARLTMRVGGRRVHFSTRTVRANGATVLVGPDRADTILFEAAVFETPSRSIPAETRILNRDFVSGNLVQFVIPAAIVNDCDANGVDDSQQTDSDGDGVIDPCDGCPANAAKTAPGVCGCAAPDADSDGDGILDCVDPCPLNNSLDSDADGTPDCTDGCPTDRNKTAPGACGCGVADVDTDEDGVPDCTDPCVGSFSNKEGLNGNADTDGDGTFDCLDGCPFDANKTTPGACGCGRADTDSNGNGVADCNEVQDLDIAILGLDSDVRLNRATGFTFSVQIGNFGANPTVLVLARRVGTLDNIIVGQSSGPLATREIMWNVDVEPGIYELNASVDDAGRTASVTAAGRLLVNVQPTLVIDSPTPNQLISRRTGFTLAWAGDDSDDNALIDILLRRVHDSVPVGTLSNPTPDFLLVENASEDDINNRDLFVDPIERTIPAGDYEVVGTIRDPLTTVQVLGPRICLSDRLVGQIPMSTLALDSYLRIAGAANDYEENRMFGLSVRFEGESDFEDGNGLLIGDPFAWWRNGEGVLAQTGIAYLFQGFFTRGGSLTSFDADLSYRGDLGGAQLGARGEFRRVFDRLGGTISPALALGAPLYGEGSEAFNGRTYWLDPRELSRRAIELCCDDIVGAVIDGFPGDQLGLDLCQLRNIDDDGEWEFAIGGTRANDEGYGVVAILNGSRYPNSGDIFSQDSYELYGETEYGAFGFDICALGDVDDDDFDDLAIGEPLGAEPKQLRTGVVHVYFGEWLFEERGNSLRSLKLVGEEELDGAGYALATGDFDDDGFDDLAVAAPFHNNARGRVYIVSNIGSKDLPNPLYLGDVGLPTIPGMIIDGAHEGDCFGFSMAKARTFDDFIDDLVVGAPVAGGERGSTWLIYGGEGLRGQRTLGPIDCDFQAAEFLRDGDVAERFGHSVSCGDFDRDGTTDIGIGAPTNDQLGGAAYIIFGTYAD